MPVVAALSKDEFDGVLKSASKFAVVYFWASWATPCVQMTAVFDKIASFGGEASFISVEAEAVPLVAQMFNVSSVPMFAFAKPDGTVFDVVVGAHPPALVGKVNQYKEGLLPDHMVPPPPAAAVVAPASAPPPVPVSDEPLSEQRNEQLRALTTAHKIMYVRMQMFLNFGGIVAAVRVCNVSRQVVHEGNQGCSSLWVQPPAMPPPPPPPPPSSPTVTLCQRRGITR